MYSLLGILLGILVGLILFIILLFIFYVVEGVVLKKKTLRKIEGYKEENDNWIKQQNKILNSLKDNYGN